MNRARTIAGLAAIGFMVPYVVLKLLWMTGLDIGVNDPDLMGSPLMLVANLMTAAMEVVGLLLALALIRPWGMKLPAWLILFPIWVGTGLLIPLMLTVPVTLIAALTSGSGEAAPLDDVLQPWVYTVVYGGFIGQGLALAVAFVLYRWIVGLARSPRGPATCRLVSPIRCNGCWHGWRSPSLAAPLWGSSTRQRQVMAGCRCESDKAWVRFSVWWQPLGC